MLSVTISWETPSSPLASHLIGKMNSHSSLASVHYDISATPQMEEFDSGHGWKWGISSKQNLVQPT